ncbi:methanethiol oxidase [Leptopilina heterotoma]|uniref:methanethiol oxidase n=1 Tax=Leptopilina heterotoma TaxID=63436 RepID=UPI001CA913AE|nr:methanethiol oxidase [Leptopilina heterotoma]
MAKVKKCQSGGPGYRSPKAAIKEGPREKLMYTVCIHTNSAKADVLCTIDIDPESSTYCQILHKLRMKYVEDELHHSGWNICSSCHNVPKKRDTLILPCFNSDRIYFVDVSNEKEPKIKKIIEPEELHKLGAATPHTSHCSPTGEIMISIIGTPDGDAQGDFISIDSNNLEIKGMWTKGDKKANFGYDFWYQPYHDVLVASEWAVPSTIKRGYKITDGSDPTLYGQSLNIYSWKDQKLLQVLDLGKDGVAPLETRFLHEPTSCEGYVGCAVSSSVFRFFKNDSGTWSAEKVIQIPQKNVEGWIDTKVPGMITEILISLDDKFLYLSNWLHGDVRQYDITDRRNPKLSGQVFLGGVILSDSNVRVLEDKELKKQPDPVYIKGRRVYGSPQMLQLSLDGRRLYVTSSLYKPWDKQFYPEHVKHGSTMLKIDVDIDNGGMTLDKNFLVDFGADKDDILLAHESRYPGGDCTSDIWLVES